MLEKFLDGLDDYGGKFWIRVWLIVSFLIAFTSLLVFLDSAIEKSYSLIYGKYYDEVPTIEQTKSISVIDGGKTIILKRK